MVEFTPDDKVRRVRALTDELFRQVLHDEEPIFFGDEATVLDVSMLPVDELTKRLSEYYRTPVSLSDLRTPLWQVLPDLDRRRKIATD